MTLKTLIAFFRVFLCSICPEAENLADAKITPQMKQFQTSLDCSVGRARNKHDQPFDRPEVVHPKGHYSPVSKLLPPATETQRWTLFATARNVIKQQCGTTKASIQKRTVHESKNISRTVVNTMPPAMPPAERLR